MTKTEQQVNAIATLLKHRGKLGQPIGSTGEIYDVAFCRKLVSLMDAKCTTPQQRFARSFVMSQARHAIFGDSTTSVAS